MSRTPHGLPQATPSLRIEDLTVVHGQQPVIKGLSLAVEQGCFFTLLGPSGCGKTTLLRAIAGFAAVTGGRILFGDTDVTHFPAHKRNIGIVFQDYALFPDKTVFDNIAYGLRARRVEGSEIRHKVAEVLERVGLGPFAARYPAGLSGGQRQRVALARALVIVPQLLLMDEPLSNLDAKLRVQVREVIAELQRQTGITTIFVTHDQEEALALSDRIGVMNSGRLEQIGTPAEIYREPATSYVADFVGGANLLPVMLDAPAHEAARVGLGGRAVLARVPYPLPAGAALLVARPEDIGLSVTDAGGVNAIIRHSQYLGYKTAYKAEIAGGAMVAIDLYGEGYEMHRPGTSVWLAFDPARTRVLTA